MKILNIVLVIFFRCGLAQASCGDTKTVLYFANGMFNSKESATQSLRELLKRVRKQDPSNKVDAFEIAYNTDEPALIQLHQVFRQKITDTSISFWRNIGKLLELEKGKNLKNIIRLLNAEQFLTDKDLREQISSYNKYLKNKFRIITVAHSQGNLYTNFAFDTIGSDETQMISVATPASDVYGEGPYFTFFSDGVIAHIPKALSANRKKQQAKYFDHEFIEHYLGDSSTSKEILSAINVNYNSEIQNSSRSLSPQEGYFNSDMNSVLKWFDSYFKEKRKLSDAECLIVEGLFSVYARHSLSCEERNFKTFRETIDDCEIDLNSSKPRNTFCPYYYGMDFANPYKTFYPTESLEHYELNPHCDMTFEKFKKVGKAQLSGAKPIYKGFIKETQNRN